MLIMTMFMLKPFSLGNWNWWHNIQTDTWTLQLIQWTSLKNPVGVAWTWGKNTEQKTLCLIYNGMRSYNTRHMNLWENTPLVKLYCVSGIGFKVIKYTRQMNFWGSFPVVIWYYTIKYLTLYVTYSWPNYAMFMP